MCIRRTYDITQRQNRGGHWGESWRGARHRGGIRGGGRSVRGTATTDHLPGTVDETAERVTASGGQGIAVRVDHTQAHEVQALFERIRDERGKLDVLVNNVWGGYEGYDDTFTLPFWEQPLSRWQGMFTAGVYAHYLASRFAAPLMIAKKRGLLISTSAGDNTAGRHAKYLGSVFYDTAKNAIDRMAQGMAFELRPYGIAALVVYPGFMSTERVQAAISGDDHAMQPGETPHYVGRAVVALAADPQIMKKSGGAYMVGHLAREYGFTDLDGTQPEPFLLPDELLLEENR